MKRGWWQKWKVIHFNEPSVNWFFFQFKSISIGNDFTHPSSIFGVWWNRCLSFIWTFLSLFVHILVEMKPFFSEPLFFTFYFYFPVKYYYFPLRFILMNMLVHQLLVSTISSNVYLFYCTFYPPGSFKVDFGKQVLKSSFKVDMSLIGVLSLLCACEQLEFLCTPPRFVPLVSYWHDTKFYDARGYHITDLGLIESVGDGLILLIVPRGSVVKLLEQPNYWRCCFAVRFLVRSSYV